MTIAVISMITEPWGGSEELWAAMAKLAISQNHRVIHLSYNTGPQHPKMKALIDEGLITYRRPAFTPKTKSLLLNIIEKAIFFLYKRTNRSLTKIFAQKPEVILYNGTCYSIAGEQKLLKMLQGANTRFYLLGHINNETADGLTLQLIAQVKNAYTLSKMVFFISERSRDNARRQIATEIPHSLVVRNPVNISSMDIIDFPTLKPTQFATVGNLIIRHKGQDIALQVLSSDVWQQRDWHLNIYGSGQDELQLKSLVTFFKLNDRVTFHGKVTDIREVWKNNHLLLMPSHTEGMPLAIVEAMLCGRPCVVTDVGGSREWITDGEEGFIAEASTVYSFNKTMERAWQQKDNWPTIGKNAHERAIKQYDPHPGKTLLDLITS